MTNIHSSAKAHLHRAIGAVAATLAHELDREIPNTTDFAARIAEDIRGLLAQHRRIAWMPNDQPAANRGMRALSEAADSLLAAGALCRLYDELYDEGEQDQYADDSAGADALAPFEYAARDDALGHLFDAEEFIRQTVEPKTKGADQ